MTLLYLTGDCQYFKGFLKPGAMHKARWMSKILFSIKIVLLNEKIAELPKGAVFGRDQLDKVMRFVQFIIFCYVPWWLRAPVAASAPSSDLNLINDVIDFKKLDSDIASSALKAFKGKFK